MNTPILLIQAIRHKRADWHVTSNIPWADRKIASVTLLASEWPCCLVGALAIIDLYREIAAYGRLATDGGSQIRRFLGEN